MSLTLGGQYVLEQQIGFGGCGMYLPLNLSYDTSLMQLY
jgi:hypothetical protein